MSIKKEQNIHRRLSEKLQLGNSRKKIAAQFDGNQIYSCQISVPCKTILVFIKSTIVYFFYFLIACKQTNREAIF